MNDSVPDGQQRLQALDPTRSFIVQAPAGSGKTELLIRRFLTLLARVDRPEAVVAITFTRKAAGEMRHRIIAALRSAAGPQPSASHEKHTWQIAREALERNNRMNWHLAAHPSRLRILTIDALCAMLVRQMPWISRIGGALRTIEDNTDLCDRAARLTVASLDAEGTPGEVSAALSTLLAHLDQQRRKDRAVVEHHAPDARSMDAPRGRSRRWQRVARRVACGAGGCGPAGDRGRIEGGRGGIRRARQGRCGRARPVSPRGIFGTNTMGMNLATDLLLPWMPATTFAVFRMYRPIRSRSGRGSRRCS